MELIYNRVRIRNPMIVKILHSVIILLILLTLTGIIGYYYVTRPEYMRKQLLTLLKNQINGNIRVEKVDFALEDGLKVYGLEIEYQNKLLIEQKIQVINIPELKIEIDYGEVIASLLKLAPKPTFKLITVEKPSFIFRFDKDGNWLDKDVFNVTQVEPESERSLRIPQIIVNDAEISLEFPMIFEEGRTNKVSNISFSILQDGSDPDIFNVSGYAEAEDIGKIEVEAVLNQETNDIDLRIFNHNVQISRERIKKFIPEIQSVYEDFIESAEQDSNGLNAEITGRVLYTPDSPALLDLDVKVINGFAKYYQFPVPIEIVVGHIKLRNYKKVILPEFRNHESLKMMRENKFQMENLSAELNIKGDYKGAYVKLHANIADIGHEDENINVVIDAKKILIDNDFKRYIQDSEDSPAAVKSFLKEFDTNGIASAIFVAGKNDIQVTLDIENVNTVFSKFPYPISKLHGKFEGAANFWDVFNLQGVTSLNEQNLSIDVKIRLDEYDNTKITAILKSDGLSLERELVELLPKQVQKVLDEHNVSGMAAIKSAEFTYVEGSKDFDYHLILSPIDIKYKWQNFPYNASFDEGIIEIDNEAVRFENISGFNGDSKITVKGWISLKHEPNKNGYDLQLKIENLVLNAELETAIFSPLPKDVYEPDKTIFTDLWNMFKPGGIVNLELRISPDENRTIFAYAEIIKASVIYEQFPLSIEVEQGILEFSNYEKDYFVKISDIVGKYKESLITFEGTLQGDPSSLFLHIEAENCRIDKELKEAYEHLEKQINKNRDSKLDLWKTIKPTGLLNMVFDIYSKSNNSQNISMIIDVSEGSAEFIYFPYALSNVSGRVMIDSSGVRLKNIVGYHNETRIDINDGKIMSEGYEIRQVITNSLIDEQFFDAVPKEWQPLIETLNIRGRFNAVIEAKISDISKEFPTIIYRLRFELPYNSINVGLEIDDLTGVILINGSVQNGQIYTVARIEYSTAKWKSYKVTAGSMDLIFADNKISINNFDSSIYGGVVKGRINIEIGENAPFSGYFKFAGIELVNVIGNISPGATALQGTIAGDLSVYGKTGEQSALQGISSFHVSDAWLMDIPIIVKLFDFVNYFNPTPINEVYGKVKIFSSRTEIEDLAVYSDAIAIYGNGTIKDNDKLDFKLSMDISPRALFYPQPIRWIVKRIEKNILPIYVVGKISNPEIYFVFPPGSGSGKKSSKKKFLPDDRPRDWRKSE